MIADSLNEAAAWVLEETEVVELAQMENEELRIRMGLELASWSPRTARGVTQPTLHDWICLYLARDSSKPRMRSCGMAAWRTLYRLTGSANSTIRTSSLLAGTC